MNAYLTPEELEAVKVIISLPEAQAQAIRAVWPAPEDSERITTALRQLSKLLAKGSKYRRASTFAALSPGQREKLLERMSPETRMEALRELDLLAQQETPLDVGAVLDEMASVLLGKLE